LWNKLRNAKLTKRESHRLYTVDGTLFTICTVVKHFNGLGSGAWGGKGQVLVDNKVLPQGDGKKQTIEGCS
jgi:hypothetical protein